MPHLNVPLERIDAYLAHLQKDYDRQNGNSPVKRTFDFSVGSTYIHVFAIDGDKQRSSHSWIVNREGAMFPLGSILKSASWRGPSRNFARGNVMTGDFSRAWWTGVS